ncbi:hypothetical protein [Streptomyces sp. NPDC008139]|uniref:hypothetical protein n=1 Tax=Streptomyces sp. NPDC008139 TaxID=3364814 RepID=UPI0036EDBE0F
MADEYITTRGLQGATAVVTARVAGLDVPQEQLLGETPASEALFALTVLVASVLNVTAPSGLTTALRTAGSLASRLEVHDDGV